MRAWPAHWRANVLKVCGGHRLNPNTAQSRGGGGGREWTSRAGTQTDKEFVHQSSYYVK